MQLLLALPLEDRQDGRLILAEVDGSEALFGAERPKASADEPDEPIDHP